MDIDRGDLVRRLLGMATQLFLENRDPVSVHCLAASSLEHAEHLAMEHTGGDFKSKIMSTLPGISERELRRLRNRHWTVIKHSHNLGGVPFDVEDELSDFDDSQNDAILFVAWYDFMSCGRPIPVAAQVFQLWFFRVYPDSLDPEKPFDFPLFDGLHELQRSEQKRLLNLAITNASAMSEVASHPMTDPSPLAK